MSIRVAVGLGNPGKEYRFTRHNLGFAIVDALCREGGGRWRREKKWEAEIAVIRMNSRALTLLKPQTFMNESGRSVGTFCAFFKIPPEHLAVVSDEANVPLGRVKITVGGTSGGHNGIASLIEHLGNGFARFRVGIGPKTPPSAGMRDYVLGKFTTDEQSLVNKKMPEYLAGLHLLIDRGPLLAMNQVNKRKSPQSINHASNKSESEL